MDALAIERCVMAGFSRGTVTAMRAVLAHPERFEGRVLMNGCGEVRSPELPSTQRLPPSPWPGATHADRMRWSLERCKAEQTVDWTSRLPQLRTPTLIVHGELAAFYRIEHMRYTQSLIPDSELVVMEGSGHLPALTRPLEVANHIERFFTARGI